MALRLQTRSPKGADFAFALDDLAATASLGGAVAARARLGDVIALHGPLGAGKTAFARAFIAGRARAAGWDDEMLGEVPSPTFTLVQTYDLPDVPVWHFDLYRLERPEDALELGLDEAFSGTISLIEWPERLGAGLPARALHVNLGFGVDEATTARVAHLNGGADWAARLQSLAGELA